MENQKRRYAGESGMGGGSGNFSMAWGQREMERINDLLGRQASVRSLARLVEKHQPERVFIYRAPAAGLLFSADRKVWTNRRMRMWWWNLRLKLREDFFENQNSYGRD